MAHGKNAEIKGHGGREYWSPRDQGMPPWGCGKKETHRKERRIVERFLNRFVQRGHCDDTCDPKY